jgi:hypothetical protein
MSIANLENLLRDVPGKGRNDTVSVPILFEGIYRYPVYFGYGDMDEDSRSAFLLSIYPLLPKLIDSYDPKRSSFVTYAVNSVKLYARSWRRDAAKEQASQDALAHCYLYEDDPDSFVAFMEKDPEYLVDPVHPVQFLGKLKTTKRYTEMVLVMALKCAHLLSPRQIEAVALTVNVSIQTLYAYVEHIKRTLGKKMVQRQQLIEERNKSWFLQARYRLELQRLEPGTAQYTAVQKQLTFQTRMLSAKNKRLQAEYALDPPNTLIGGMLNMSPKKVTRLLEQSQRSLWKQALDKQTAKEYDRL